jgi:SAM-dependent methyltransferase
LKQLKHIVKRSLYFLTNNVVVNNILIALGKDRYFSQRGNPYTTYVPAGSKSVQENAGYSNREEINQVLEKSKSDLLQITQAHLQANAKILDIGCGPGMYLSLFKDLPYELHATDINSGMLALAKKEVPRAIFYEGDIHDVTINETFDLIYCIGVLIYIPPSGLQAFIKKITSLLNDGGILYLNFPHAISFWDTWYKDIAYVQYSPAQLRKVLAPWFDVVTDHHAFDNRVIEQYDKTPYKSLNPDTHRTYKNSYLLVAKKKHS